MRVIRAAVSWMPRWTPSGIQGWCGARWKTKVTAFASGRGMYRLTVQEQ
jgi:hypothetical protein